MHKDKKILANLWISVFSLPLRFKCNCKEYEDTILLVSTPCFIKLRKLQQAEAYYRSALLCRSLDVYLSRLCLADT
jgi:hypothetical protein